MSRQAIQHPRNESSEGSAVAPTIRKGRVAWLTRPPSGVARLVAGAGALSALPATLCEDEPGAARPGDLLALAHGMFMASAVAELLEEDGVPAREIVVEATCTFSGAPPDTELESIRLDVHARVPGCDSQSFDRVVTDARGASLRAIGASEDLAVNVSAFLEHGE